MLRNKAPAISILTPSFNMLSYLKLCHASVIDQGVNVEHIVMDGGSTDGTAEWLSANQDIISVSEKDNGMYQALNKAIQKSQATIIGHLNCDEQYLPGILPFVEDFFVRNPDVDFLAGNFLVIGPDGKLLAYRKSFQPRWPYFFSNYLYTTTCTLFYRARVFKECRFDESYKSIADVIFLYGVLRKGFKGVHINKYFASFTFSGKNLSLHPLSLQEKKRFNRSLGAWYKILKPLFFLTFFVEKALHGNYWEKRILSYSIFTPESPHKRVTFTKKNPGFRLKFRGSGEG